MPWRQRENSETWPGRRWLFRIVLPALLVAAGCQGGELTRTPPTEAELPGPHATTLNIVTLNTHLLPEVAIHVAGRRGAGDYRAGAIPGRLAGYDILGLCETFDNERTEILLAAFQEQAGTEWHHVRSPQRTERLSAGGLLLISRFPIEESHWLQFENASRITQDGLARKGVLHARLRIAPGENGLVDCFLTHLDSQVQSVRLAQVREMAAFMTEHSTPERPMILLGDLNITADPPGTTYESLAEGESPTSYLWLMEGLKPQGEPLIDVWAEVGEGPGHTLHDLPENGGRRVDYILLGTSQGALPAGLRLHDAYVLPLEDEQVPEGSLSDHAGVACRATFLWLDD